MREQKEEHGIGFLLCVNFVSPSQVKKQKKQILVSCSTSSAQEFEICLKESVSLKKTKKYHTHLYILLRREKEYSTLARGTPCRAD